MDIRSLIPFGHTPEPENMAPGDDALKSPLEQIPEGYQQTFQPLINQGLGLAHDAGQAISQGAHEAGLALGRGVDAITPSRDTLGRIFMALEAGGAAQQGRTPLFMQMQDQQNQMQMRRDMIAQQAQQAEESKRQHNMGIAMKLIETGNLDGLTEFGNEWEPAKRIAMAVSKKDLAELPGLVDGGYVPKAFADSVMNDQLPPNQRPTIGQIQSKVRFGLQMKQKDDENDAKNHYLEQAVNTPKEKRTFSQQLIVDEHQAKLDNQEADTALKYANASKAWLNPEGDQPDRSEDNRIHQALNGGLPWAQGTNESRQAALQYKSKMYAQGKTDVTSGTPVSQLGKQQELRDPVTGKAIPGWATTAQANAMGYVNIEPTQISTVNQLQNVDEALKEILASGSALVRQATGHGLFDIPSGLLQTPIVALTTKYAGDPNAALLRSAITRITPSLSKLGGDTGNVAVEERKMYADSIFTESDTLGSLVAKVKSVKQATDRTREAMGFLPDEKSLIRRLVIQGKTDEQIKAILEERKRMQ